MAHSWRPMTLWFFHNIVLSCIIIYIVIIIDIILPFMLCWQGRNFLFVIYLERKPKDLISQRRLRKVYSKLYSHSGFAVYWYTHSYSFNPHVRLHAHLADWTVGLLNQADRNKYPYNPNIWGTPGMEIVTTCLASVY